MQRTYVDDNETTNEDCVCATRDTKPLLSMLTRKSKSPVRILLNDEPLDHNDDDDDDVDGNGAKKRLLLSSSTSSQQLQNAYRRNRRYHHGSERWGRIRLGIASIVFVCVIYFCFVFGTWMDDQRQSQMIVQIPPPDDSLPGPKGIYWPCGLLCSVCFCFRSILCFFRVLFGYENRLIENVLPRPCPWDIHSNSFLIGMSRWTGTQRVDEKWCRRREHTKNRYHSLDMRIEKVIAAQVVATLNGRRHENPLIN